MKLGNAFRSENISALEMWKPVSPFELDTTRSNCKFDQSNCDTHKCRHFLGVARKSNKAKVVAYVYGCRASALHTPSASFTYAVAMHAHYHFLQKINRKAIRRSQNFRIKDFSIPRDVLSLRCRMAYVKTRLNYLLR